MNKNKNENIHSHTHQINENVTQPNCFVMKQTETDEGERYERDRAHIHTLDDHL